MRAHLGDLEATADIDITIRIQLTLEPGIWVVREDDGYDYAVTGVQGLIDADGIVHWTYPKGVGRRPNGLWAARERILHRALPQTHPAQAWAVLPDPVRKLIEDSYLLSRDDIPLTIGRP